MNAWNLCDIELHWETVEQLENLQKKAEKKQQCHFDRIYIGSYFCGRYFLHLVDRHLPIWMELYKKHQLPFVVVLPIFSQTLLPEAREAIEKIRCSLGNAIAYFVVNDPGMLSALGAQNVPICLGRLFAKDTRDFRDAGMRKRDTSCAFWNGTYQILRKEFSSVMGIELDNIYSLEALKPLKEDKETRFILHTPYVYQSVGQICCYANLESENNSGFYANRPCSYSCARYYLTYGEKENQLLRAGRAVLYKESATKQEMEGLDICVWPFDLWEEEDEDEDTSAFTGV